MYRIREQDIYCLPPDEIGNLYVVEFSNYGAIWWPVSYFNTRDRAELYLATELLTRAISDKT